MQILIGIFGEGKELTMFPMMARGIVVFFIALLLIRISGRRSFGLHMPLDNIINIWSLVHHKKMSRLLQGEKILLFDVIFRIAGTGSVGLNRFTFLLKTLNTTGVKYFLLDMKEAARSSLTTLLRVQQPKWTSEAERIVTIQKKMQNRVPALLSTSTFRGKDYIMQEVQPTKDSIDFNLLKKRYREMYRVIYSMAVLTASSQLRSSGRRGSATTDALIEFASKDSWQRQIMAYAFDYSNKVRNYYKEFLGSFQFKRDR